MAQNNLLKERRGRVLLLTLSDPPTRNALHPAIYRAGIEILQQAGEDADIGAVVLTGAQGTFCSGGNLDRLNHNRTQPRAIQQDSITLFHAWIQAIGRCPKPVIAAVEGYAAGAGFALALACDLLVAAQDARFVMAYVKVGLSPDGGASLILSRSLTPQLAAEILLDGQPVAATRLHHWGLVNRLCPPGRALQEALEWAERLAAGPGFAMERIKHLLDTARDGAFTEHLEREREAFLACLYQPQCAEGIAAFLEKRRPDFIGAARGDGANRPKKV
jgi:enoyl-CoA hydratase/carnithine racemase